MNERPIITIELPAADQAGTVVLNLPVPPVLVAPLGVQIPIGATLPVIYAVIVGQPRANGFDYQLSGAPGISGCMLRCELFL